MTIDKQHILERLRDLVLLVGSLMAITCISATAASACTCADLPPAQLIDHADSVFRGRVISKVRSDDLEKNGVKVTFSVAEVWKGAATNREIVIYTGATADLYPFEAMCAVPFTIGGEYLVLANGKDKLQTDVCTGTSVFSQQMFAQVQQALKHSIKTHPKKRKRSAPPRVSKVPSKSTTTVERAFLSGPHS